MTAEIPCSCIDPDKPWLSQIVCGPGDCEEIKKAGKISRDKAPPVQEVTVTFDKVKTPDKDLQAQPPAP
jgi:hypothetical protein